VAREHKIGEAPAQCLPYYLTAGTNRMEHLMNIHATHEKLAAKGAPFDFPPRETSGRTQAVFRDPDGNGLVLSQRR
jgi:catechol 2,3-dioxygenase-like lactoylglutathione lyase family enzyme